MKRSIGLIFLLASFFVIAGCNAGPDRTNIEIIPDMMDQVSIKAQDWDPNSDGGAGQRVPPEHTVPRGFTPEKYKGDFVAMEKNLRNPLAGDMSPEIIELGKAKYEIYCSICHGYNGDGQSEIGKLMPVLPRNFLEKSVINLKDGRYYSAIVNGYGIMGSYAGQIFKKHERWAVVNYVRMLQQQAGN